MGTGGDLETTEVYNINDSDYENRTAMNVKIWKSLFDRNLK